MKHRLLTLLLRFFWFCRSGRGPENLHFPENMFPYAIDPGTHTLRAPAHGQSEDSLGRGMQFQGSPNAEAFRGL